MNPKLKSRISLFLKIAFVAVLLFFMAKKGFLSAEETLNALRQWNLVLPAFGFLILTLILASWRWHLLLLAAGLNLGYRRTLEFNVVGLFFNIALPGSVTGDVVKAYYCSREAKGSRAPVLSTIIFDRVCGVSGLILVGVGALLLQILGIAPGANLPIAVRAPILGLGFGVIAFFVYLFLVRDNWDPVLQLLQRLQNRYTKVGSITRLYEGIKSYGSQKKTTLSALGLSLIIQILVALACIHFTWAMGDTEIPTLSLAVVIPLGLLVMVIPVLPGGMGTGHAAFLALFHLLGSQRGADVFNLFLLNNLVQGAIGGLFYLRFRSKTPITGTPLA
jgi:uncharacterized protein (TIRG00374 family)